MPKKNTNSSYPAIRRHSPTSGHSTRARNNLRIELVCVDPAIAGDLRLGDRIDFDLAARPIPARAARGLVGQVAPSDLDRLVRSGSASGVVLVANAEPPRCVVEVDL